MLLNQIAGYAANAYDESIGLMRDASHLQA
jgi:hypothetical protein